MIHILRRIIIGWAVDVPAQAEGVVPSLKVFEGRGEVGYDHGYDAEVFYLGLALDPNCVEDFAECCLERIGEDYPEDEATFRDLREDEAEKHTVLDILKAECEVRPGRPQEYR